MLQIIVDVVEAEPVKKELGKVFKAEAKAIMDTLAALNVDQVGDLEKTLKADGYAHQHCTMLTRTALNGDVG